MDVYHGILLLLIIACFVYIFVLLVQKNRVTKKLVMVIKKYNEMDMRKMEDIDSMLSPIRVKSNSDEEKIRKVIDKIKDIYVEDTITDIDSAMDVINKI